MDEVARAAGRGVEIPRRQFIKTVAAGTGAALLVSGVAQTSEGTEWVAGVVESANSESLLLRIAEGSTVTVTLSQGGEVRRDEVISMENLRIDEEMNAEGSWQDAVFVATLISPTYRLVDGVVKEKHEMGIVTEKGWIAFNEHTKPKEGWDMEAKPLEEIQPGDAIRALGRLNPKEFVALRVGTIHKNP